MRGYESAAWRDPAAVRKTMRGSGMVTTTKTVTVTYESGRSETLKAGITRLSPDHQLVKQRPGLFRPCDTNDKATVMRMRQYAGTRERTLEQATRTRRPRTPTPRTHGRYQLGPRRPTRHRLR